VLHTLKGLAATLGATALAAQAGRSEKLLGQAARPSQVKEAAESACDAIATALPGLRALLDALHAAAPGGGAMPTATATGLDARALDTAMRSLGQQLRHADMAATETMAALMRDFGAALGERLQPLDDAVGALDFEHASQLCAAFIDARLGEPSLPEPA
jgi:two-component system, sensor histidine kinase and response regulator